jgi:hypothetical protein
MGGGAVNGMPIFPRGSRNHDETDKKVKKVKVLRHTNEMQPE